MESTDYRVRDFDIIRDELYSIRFHEDEKAIKKVLEGVIKKLNKILKNNKL